MYIIKIKQFCLFYYFGQMTQFKSIEVQNTKNVGIVGEQTEPPLKYPLGVHLEQNVHIVKTIEARIKRTFVCLSISMIFFLRFLHHQWVFSLEINLDFKSEHWLPPYAIWISIEHSCGEYVLKQKKCSNEFVHLIWVKVSNCNCIGAFNISKNET